MTKTATPTPPSNGGTGSTSASPPPHPKMLTEVVSCAQAKMLGQAWYFTGKPCKHGHIAKRDVKNGECRGCKRKHTNSKRNRDAAKHREFLNTATQVCVRCNKQKPLVSFRFRKAQNKDLCTDCRRKRDENERRRGKNSLRDRAVRQQTPPWADRRAILAKYKEARWMSMRTGYKHEVDHFYPLNGKDVCGLHVPENLRVVLACFNNDKSNLSPNNDRYPI